MSFQPKKARPHHYEFAHRVLPQLGFRDPPVMFQWLETGSQAWMSRNWELVNIRLEKQGVPRCEWSAGPAIKVPTPIGDVFFVHPPAPEGFAECAWVAFFRFGTEGPPDRQLGYFTLELGFDGTGKPYDLLCAWNSQNKHLNSGITLGSREPQWGAKSILEWLARPAVAASTQK